MWPWRKRSYPSVHEVVVGGRTARFLVTNPEDMIQAHFLRGEFAEGPFLVDLLDYLPKGAVVLDIGANIGNHTVWFAAFGGASKVVPFELQPVAIDLLQKNVALNDLSNVDLSMLGVGCGEAPSTVVIGTSYDDNLGATAFRPTPENSELPTFRVDSVDRLLPVMDVDFVKVDVEGMEVSVLRGMSELVARCRPMVYAEIWHQSVTSTLRFLDWLAHTGYRVERQHGPNFLCVPIAAGSEARGWSGASDEVDFATFSDDDGPRRQEALARLAEGAGKHWQNPFAIHFAAHALCHHGDAAEALRLVDKAAAMASDSVAFLQTRLAIVDKLEDEDQLVETLARLAALLPDDQMLHTRLVDLLWQSGCRDRARSCIDAALRRPRPRV